MLIQDNPQQCSSSDEATAFSTGEKLGEAYRTVYEEMNRILCMQQEKIKELDGDALEQARTEMFATSSIYYSQLQGLRGAVSNETREEFRKTEIPNPSEL
jgi:hypothetical protein